MGGDKALSLSTLNIRYQYCGGATKAEMQELCLDVEQRCSEHTSCQERSGKQTAQTCIKACGVGGVTVERDSGCRMTMTSSKTRTGER